MSLLPLASIDNTINMKKILVLGPRERVEEFQKLEIQNASVKYADSYYFDSDDFLADMVVGDQDESKDPLYWEGASDLENYDVIFDLDMDDNPDRLVIYFTLENTTVIGCAVSNSLGKMAYYLEMEPACVFVGMNALPTFINRELLELSLYNESQKQEVSQTLEALGLQPEWVDDRPGMVSARVICMIINEACFVLKEGTADIPGVDRAMKLGTAYPRGPFEWADAIGIENVHSVLEGLQEESGEEKYKVAPLLKQYFYRRKKFYA